jgi:hypothetical protein
VVVVVLVLLDLQMLVVAELEDLELAPLFQ